MFNTSLGHKIIDIYNEKGVSGIKSDGGVIDLLKRIEMMWAIVEPPNFTNLVEIP